MFKFVNVNSLFVFPSYYLTNQHKCPTHKSLWYKDLSSTFKWLWRLVRFSCWLEKIYVKSLQWNVMKKTSGPWVIKLLLTSDLSLTFPLFIPFKKIETEIVRSSKFSGPRTWSVFRLIIIIDLWYPYIWMLTCQKKLILPRWLKLRTQCLC